MTQAQALMEVLKAFTAHMGAAEKLAFSKDVQEALKKGTATLEGTLAQAAAQHVKDAMYIFGEGY